MQLVGHRGPKRSQGLAHVFQPHPVQRHHARRRAHHGGVWRVRVGLECDVRRSAMRSRLTVAVEDMARAAEAVLQPDGFPNGLVNIFR
jgi:hypothetical protein